MWLSRGLLASTLVLAVKAQDDGIEDAAIRIASGFAATLIQNAVTTLHGDTGSDGNPGQMYGATNLDKPETGADSGANNIPITQQPVGQPSIATYTHQGTLFPVTLLPHPVLTIPPSSNDPYERVIQAYTGGDDATTKQEITVAEPSGTKPGTIIVDVPGTAYSSFSSGQPGALTIPPSNDNPTATIISALPSGVAITGDATRTVPANGNDPATVIIQTPWTDVPPSTIGAGADGGAGAGDGGAGAGADGGAGDSGAGAGADGGGAGGGGAGDIGGDSTSDVLVIQTYTGTEYITQARVTTVAGPGGVPTKIVQVPANQNPGSAITIPPSDGSHFTTIIGPYTGATPISTPVTTLIPTSAGKDGTIIIQTPNPSSTDSSGSEDGNLPENQPQIIPPSGDNPYSTILRPHDGPITKPITYTIPPSGTNPGTVIIETPAVRAGQEVITLPPDPNSGYITIVRQPGSVITAPKTITIAPSGGQPGTIVIETPVATRPGDAEITIPPGADGSYITIIRSPTGTNVLTAPTTITMTGAPGQPGTVIIETPGSSGGDSTITRAPGDPFTLPPGPGSKYVTVFRPHSGDPISVPITLTQEGQNGQPGTIIIETPDPTSNAPGSGPITIPAGSDSPYVTVYKPHTGSPISKPITVTIPPSGTNPGTIIVETPTLGTPIGQNAVTSAVTDGEQVTIPPGNNDPYVTIYKPHTGDPITAPITITQPPSNGQPGTIIIETQGPITINPTSSGGTATIYTPGTAVGATITKVITLVASGGSQSTAVVIETPPVTDQPSTQQDSLGTGRYVTVTSQYTGTDLTEVITSSVPGLGTNPGTVYIITPPAVKFNPTSSSPGSTVKGSDNYVTIYKPFPGPGIINTPITITQATPSGGQPGTIVIETPTAQTPVTTPLPNPSTTQGPNGLVTVFLPFPGPGLITTSYTRTLSGTVYITTPAPSSTSVTLLPRPSTTQGSDGLVTVFLPFPGPGVITTSYTRTLSGTVYITTPALLPTSVSLLPRPSTTQGSNGYVTVFLPFPGPGTITAPITSTQAPSGNQPGTVFITTPAPLPVTSQQNLPSATSGDDGYVTVFIPYPGPGQITAPITSTQPPSGGQPGTVFITTPSALAVDTPKQQNQLSSTTSGADGFVTVFLPFPGPGVITAPITSTQAPSGGNPGTVYITTPAAPALSTPGQQVQVTSTSPSIDVYVTVFLPFPGPGVITEPITRTQPPSGGNPGTVYITAPAPQATQQDVHSTEPGVGQYVTVFFPFPGPGVITEPITRTQAAPSGGNPGTVFVTTPAPPTPTQQTPALTTDNYITVHTPFPGPGVITVPVTITKPPSSGQPGTILIQTPAPVSSTDSYVTIFRPYPGPGTITAPVTLTQAPSNGQPGTVFIETQPISLPTSASPITIPPNPTGTYITVYRPYPGPGNINSPVSYTQAPVSGQPGTVIIETPNPNANTATQTGPVTVPTGDNNPYVTVYKPYPGPGNIDRPITITAVTPSGGQPGTIIIETPVVEVETKFALSTAPISQPESQATTKATENPPTTIPQGQDGYVTVYQPHSGSGAITEPVTISTVAPTNGQPGTVFIETPTPAVATPSTKEQPTVSAVTIPAGNGGYVTVYRPYPGPGMITEPRTVGTVAPTSGQAGTIIIETPVLQAVASEATSAQIIATSQGNDGYMTVFKPYTGTNVIAQPITVTTIAPSAGQPGTVVVETPVPPASMSTPGSNDVPVTIPPGPDNSYATVYRPHTGANIITAPVAISTIAGVNGQPGTVIIETPTGQSPTLGAISDQGPVTIPAGPDSSYATVYRPYTGSGAITEPIASTIPRLNGEPGTVVVETPVPLFSASTQVAVNTPVTVPPGPDNSYATIYRPHTGVDAITAPVTSTISGMNGQPGTVIVETPVTQELAPTQAGDNPAQSPGGSDNSYVTDYRPYTGIDAITAPVTSTIPGANGQPGTVIIETPAAQFTGPVEESIGASKAITVDTSSSYITVYRPHTVDDGFTTPVTVTTIQGANGQPGTIVIEAPGLETGGKVVVPPLTLEPTPGGQYTTIYRPHTGSSVITAPITVTTIAPSGGQPGTVIIETPQPETIVPNPTVTLPSGPDASYVTILRPHTGSAGIDGISGPITITTIAPDNGQPGTIIIETPVVPESVIVPTPSGSTKGAESQNTPVYHTVYRPNSGPSRITAPVTISTIEPTGGQPGTVIVETPDQDLAPITTSSGPGAIYITVYQPCTRTERMTEPTTVTTIPPINNKPGTVVIETPGQQAPPTTHIPVPVSYVTITKPHTGTGRSEDTVTTTIPPQGDQPGTVIIEPASPPMPSVPIPSLFVTITRPYTGSGEITEPVTTTIAAQDNQPGTVIVETPERETASVASNTEASYISISRPYTGTDQITAPVVTTVPPRDGQPGTVIFETQAPFATIYRPYTGSDQITGPVTVSAIAPVGDKPGTIIVETPGGGAEFTTTPPAPSYVTSSVLYTGDDQIAAPTVLTTIPPEGNQPGTVIIGTPGSYVTSTTVYMGSDSITGPTALTTIQPHGTQAGVVVIAIPPYVTTTSSYTGTDQITAPITVTAVSPQGDQPGTVVIETQAPFATVYRPHTGPGRITAATTVTTIAPSGNQPGTVVVETPGSEPPVTTTPPSPSYTTVYEQYSGTDDMTAPSAKTTIEPQSDEPGTVIFETPGQKFASTSAALPATYVNVYQPHTGPDSITAPVTISDIPPQGGQPGTYIIETPGSKPAITSIHYEPSYVTFYQPHTGDGTITEPVTVTTLPPQGDQPGTVVIETPGSEPPVTVRPSAEPSYETIYRPHTGSEQITTSVTITTIPPQGHQPGTVIIETPGPHTGSEQIKTPVTVTTIAPQGDQPGTVIVETPDLEPATSTLAPQATYFTIYRPGTGVDRITTPVAVTTIEPQGGQPGTVIVETPGSQPPITSGPALASESSYIMIYTPHTGVGDIVAPVTLTTIPGQSGQPGTVIIETPGSQPPVTSESSMGPATSYITVYKPYNGTEPITAPVTITEAPEDNNQPGTVIIETPGSGPPFTLAPSAPYTTIYVPYTGTGEITGEITRAAALPQGDQPGTLIIETPGPHTENKGAIPVTVSAGVDGYVTVFKPYTGTDSITEPRMTTVSPSGGQLGTVIVETPVPETEHSSGDGSPPLTLPPGDDTYATIFRPHTGPGLITQPVTITTIAPSAGQPGTVIIETPEPESGPESTPTTTSAPGHVYVTIYRPYTGTAQITAPITITTTAPGSDTGTVIIETLAPTTASVIYVTIHRPYTGTEHITEPTTTTIAPISGTGTVVIETPITEPTTEGPVSNSPEITIPPSNESHNSTIIRPYSGTESITGPITKYLPPTAAGEPGTIVIETPVDATTPEAQPSDEASSHAQTNISPSDGTPNVTVVREHTGSDTITAPITLFEPPSASGQPGTVIIETPASKHTSKPVDDNVTIYTLAPPGVKTPVTSYKLPENSGEPGTVFIQTVPSEPAPMGANVTITREEYSGLLGPFTTYLPPGASGDPGTFIIDLPAGRPSHVTSDGPVTVSAHSGSHNVTIVRSGPGSQVTTIFMPPTGSEAGTVIIETPTASPEQGDVTASPSPLTDDKPGVTIPPSSNSPNMTIIRPYPGPGSITEPITRYLPPTAAGEPGTVVIETNASDSPEPTTNNPEITLPPTSQSPNTTVIRPYTGPGSIIEPITRYIPPTAAGEPGTIVIETQSTDASDTSTEAESADEPSAITLSASHGSPNITIIRGVTGSEVAKGPVTKYIEPTKSGEPGTILIETPVASEPDGTSESQEPAGGPSSISAVPTTPEDSLGSTSSNHNAITVTPSDANNDVTVIEPNTRFPDAIENVTQIIPPSNGNPGTKIIYTPIDTSSVEEASPGASGTANFVTVSATVTIPGDPSTRTGVRSSPGAEPTTTGKEINTIIIPPSGTEPGTVVLQTSVYLDQTLAEHGNVTITRAAPAGITKILTTYAPPAVSTDPGTFIIEVPDYNVTITQQARTSIASPFTTYLPPGSQGDPGTVVIEVPSYSATTGSHVSLPASGPPETEVTATGPSNTTIYSGVSGNVVKTIYYPPTNSGERGTVIVQTPAESSKRTNEEETPTSAAIGGRTNTTIYTAGSGTVRTTALIQASSPGEPDTVLIQTPATNLDEDTSSAGHYTTVFTVGTETATRTTTISATAPGEPDTILIQTPATDSNEDTSSARHYNTTVFTGGAGTATRTTIISATEPGEPDTILVMTPTGDVQETGGATTTPPPRDVSNVTISRGGPGSALTTIYQPATASNEPGTVIIETPTGSFEAPKIAAAGTNVTVYSGGHVTATRTIYIPPTASDDAGTVIIETPDGSTASRTGSGNITIYTGVSGTATKTRFIPATVTDEPGMILIETPTGSPDPQTGVSNITIYTGFAGTTVRTTFISGTASDEPGTVMVETPTGLADSSSTGTAPGNVTIHTGYSGSVTETRYIPPTRSGEAGTIVIETPIGDSVDKETSSDRISDSSTGTVISPQQRENTTVYTGGPNTVAQTKYIPATASDEPDTILIQTPTNGIDTGSGTSAPIPGAAKPNVTIYSAGAGMDTSPIYLPPASSGEAGTIIILTPTGSAEQDSTRVTGSRETESQSPSTRNVTVTRPAPGSITSMYTTYMPPGSPGDPGTVIVETPDYNVTITRQAPASVTSVRLSYVAPGTIGDPGTVIMETPNNAYNITITRAAPASVTRMLTTYAPPDSPGDPGTVIIETPDNNVTVTQQAPASITSPITRYIPPGTPGDPGTVIVETPNNDYNVTITRAAPASVTSMHTTYAPPGTPGDPGTIIVETPNAVNNDYNVTVTRAAPASVKSLYTTYVPPGASGDPGTVIVETPAGAYNVTTTRGASVTAPLTTYIAAVSPGDPGTILIETPDYNTTITREAPISVTSLRTIYNPPGDLGDPGTVIIETPRNEYNVTVTKGASITVPTTKYSPPATPGDPGTIIVETPDYNVTVTRQGPKSVTTVFSTYLPPGSPGDPGTIIVETPVGPYNVTTTQGASTITAPLTTYLPPSSPGDPGTVLIETPEYNVTVTRKATDSASDTVTSYDPPATPGDPGTVAIIMPNQRVVSTSQDPSTSEPGQNTTIYRAGPRSLTGPVTSFIPPQSAGDSGTVIIETPGPATPFNVTTTQTVRTITAIYTTFLPAGAQDDPGTVLVEVPPERNVTVTQQDTAITAAYTSYSPPGAAGDPGTVIVGIPADRNVSITSIESTRTVPYTTYLPPANRGDPGTVLVELPPDSNITTTKTVSDRTAPYTTYAAPANKGDPGTIIVEVPMKTEYNVTVTNVASSITSPYTSYSPPANPGDPGTVFIGLHPDSNITITTEINSRTAPYTTYLPAASQGDPGTILIEVPPADNVTITTQVTGLTAPYTKYSPPGNAGDPGTVLVELPPDSNINFTTTKEVSSRTAPFTTYSAPANRGDPGTVIIEMPPSHNVTVTTQIMGLTAPYTTYSPAASAGDPGTIIVQLPPDSNVTVTKEVSSRTAPFTTYSAPANRGDPGTVVIEMPPDRNTTITTTIATRTLPYTTYATPGNKGDVGTVIIEMPPDRNITVTTEVSSLTKPYTTYASPANEGDPGTVIIQMPPDRNVTVTTEVPTITRMFTTYAAPANKGDPGTVIVEMPPDRNVTVTTVVPSLTKPYTTYAAPANKGDPGTIIVEMPPDRNITVTTEVPTLTRMFTTYAAPANKGDPGTVIIEVPPPRNITITTTVASLSTPYTAYSAPGSQGDPGTIIIEMPPERNITTTQQDVGTITRLATTYLPPANPGDPGTIVIEVPRETNTTVVEVVSTITRPVTRFVPPANQGDPGTIYLDVPPSHTVTMTTTVSTISRPTTIFETPATEGDAATVLVEMPPEYNVTTTNTVQSISRPLTRYSTPAEIGDPGTVFIDLPPEYNVTVTTTIPTITRQSTTFAPAATQGDPGTIIIEMPPAYNITSTQTIQTISRPVTRYSGPAEIGDPGTVFVLLPPEYNITVTTTINTITRPTTTFAPADIQGDPGTIIIELPPDTNTTMTQTVSTITRPTTRYSRPGTIGDPGTVYVDLPPEYNITITKTVNTITKLITTFASPDTQGNPGTVIVELPPDSNVTISSTVPTISRPATRFASPAAAGDPGTVYVDLPPDYNVTTTATIDSITRVRTAYNSAATQGDPGTIVIQVPPDYNVTTTQTVNTISRVRTTYYPAGTQGDPNTVLIQVPVDYNVTTTATVDSITRVRTTYNPGATQGDPGTVIIQIPVESNVTTTQTISTISRVQTSYYPAGVQGDPNTVLIQVPIDHTVTSTQTVSTITRAQTSYYPAGVQGDPNTVLVQVPPSYNTTSTQTVSTITRVQTSYYPAGVQGDPNTLLVQVPPSYNITTTKTMPTITMVTTIYVEPANQGDPGTVLVEVPPSRNITTTQTISTISRVQTSYYPAANLGDANTVLVQVPVDRNVTVTQTVPTISRATTIYNPPATQGDPGTVLVEVPPSYNVTTTQTVPTITRVSTTYASPAVQGDPGTVIIQIPPSYNVTTTQTVPSISRVATVYSAPAVQGDPGTIIVQIPPSYNVTTTQTVPTISRVATVYNPPAVQGDPGTIIVELPPSYNVTTTQTVPTISQVATVYSAPAVQGDPGTVIVQMPPAYNITSTQTVATINQVMTSFMPATAPGSPGTVLIQVPLPVSSTLTTIAPPIVSSAIIKSTSSSTSTSSKMPQASFGPTFDCDGYGYTISTLLGNTLTQVNLNTGQRTTIKSGIGPGGTLLNVAGVAGAINAIGFNKLDYYIYGTVNQGLVNGLLCGLLGCPSSQLIRIAKNGAYETLPLTIPSNMIDMGDVDDQGRFWVSENGKKWWCIDVNPASPTFGKLLSSGTSATDILAGVGDWAYVPGGGDYLYAVQASAIESGLLRTNIVRWSRTTHTWERYQSYPNLVLTATNLVWGAVMAGPNTLWAQENLLGQTWRFTIGSSANPTPIPGGSILNLQGDGARCPDAKTVFGPPFKCDGNGYVMSNLLGNTLTQVNLNDGTRSTVANGIGPGIINAIGYNTLDNYIYGMVIQGLSSSLIRIAQDGAYEILPVTIPSIIIDMGDVDNQGRLWVSESGKRWWCIDVNPSSSTFSTLLKSGTSTADILSGVGDWAYIAGAGNYLYAVQASVIESGLLRTNIVRWSLTTQTWERYQSYSNFVLTSLNLNWGAVMGGPGGTLYAQENLLGQTWKFTLGSTSNPTSLPGGTILNLSGDGARCVALDPTTINLPPSTTVTVTTTISTISQVLTTIAMPSSQGDPATAIVQVPAPYNVTTTQTVSTLTKATTVFESATALGSPGTILIQYPLPYTVTITTNGGTTINGPVTSTLSPGQPGDPATVIIATPSSPPAAATSSAAAQPALKCDVYGYLMQKTAFYRVDLTSGKTTLINALVGPGGNINAIGYNKFDNFIYGMLQDSTGTQVIRIAGDGSYTLLAARTSDRSVNMGDIDNLGRYWIATSAKAWWCIDLMPGSATYGKIIMSGTAVTTLTAADWAFVPGGGDYMYAVMVDSGGLTSTLGRFSRTSYTWTTVKAYGNVAGSNFWGAVYASQDGNLYGSENNSGQIFKFPVAPTAGNPVFIATGPASSSNDGARCIDSQTLPV
ncbi:hypothetical protein BFJ65_g9725 [Fusarium oxysporum f. sp. cepae]|uniref:DUF6923 domain-containing protein n=1 Tax=Fusarium oxysporum f. sp. cepae TaxID=396571 RepID=A0A3L6NG38_FUSOX|nr:hypothetical protein BFJ65_g9725 [Fusarium oxysporum f. sp. cepae]